MVARIVTDDIGQVGMVSVDLDALDDSKRLVNNKRSQECDIAVELQYVLIKALWTYWLQGYVFGFRIQRSTVRSSIASIFYVL